MMQFFLCPKVYTNLEEDCSYESSKRIFSLTRYINVSQLLLVAKVTKAQHLSLPNTLPATMIVASKNVGSL